MGVDTEMVVVTETPLDVEAVRESLSLCLGVQSEERDLDSDALLWDDPDYRFFREADAQDRSFMSFPDDAGERTHVYEVQLCGERYFYPFGHRGRPGVVAHVADEVERITGGRVFVGPDCSSAFHKMTTAVRAAYRAWDALDGDAQERLRSRHPHEYEWRVFTDAVLAQESTT